MCQMGGTQRIGFGSGEIGLDGGDIGSDAGEIGSDGHNLMIGECGIGEVIMVGIISKDERELVVVACVF